jgi:hypothetical protein
MVYEGRKESISGVCPIR